MIINRDEYVEEIERENAELRADIKSLTDQGWEYWHQRAMAYMQALNKIATKEPLVPGDAWQMRDVARKALNSEMVQIHGSSVVVPANGVTSAEHIED